MIYEQPQKAPEIASLETVFQRQQSAFANSPFFTADERIAHLRALDGAMRKHQDRLAAELSADYGHRSADEFKMAEMLFGLEGIKYCIKNVKRWMRADKRHVPALQMPAKARVEYQPLGVVGVIVPWNYPVFLAVGPLMYALAAGNRVMIKMSGYTPRLALAFKAMLAEIYDEDHVAVVTGQGAISEAFPKLPFNQITFTGSTNVGRIVMQEAGKNLTPVLLELGGKSPVIMHQSFPVEDAVARLAFGKCWNAGQTCVAADHAYLPTGKVDEFVSKFSAQIRQMYPTLLNNPDYTSIINDKQYRRIQGYLDDAREQGARIIEINPANEDFSGSRKMPVTLVTGVTRDMQIMQNEIFGPVLPLLEYSDLDEVLKYINRQPRPLALYYFDYDNSRIEHVIANSHSGGVTVNDVMSHVAVDDLPFGGVGASGMGKYHGHEGFLAMSNARSVLIKSRFNGLKYIMPPFNKPAHGFIKRFLLS